MGHELNGRTSEMTRRSLLAVALATAVSPSWAQEGAAPVPFFLSDYQLPFVEVFIGQRRALALIDSGSVRGVQISERLATKISLDLSDSGATTRRYAGSRASLRGRLEAISIGPWTFASQDVDVSPGDIEQISRQVKTDFDAILGWPLLSARGFTLDYRDRTLTLEAAETTIEPRLAVELAPAILPVTRLRIGECEAAALIDTGAPMCNLDVSLAGGAAAGTIVGRPTRIGAAELELEYRVKDLAAIRETLGCAAVLGNNLLARYRLRFARGASILQLT